VVVKGRRAFSALANVLTKNALITDGKKNERATGSNPLSKFRDVAQFQHKYALDCALRVKVQISEFVRFAQNYAIRLSECVRNSAFFLRGVFSAS
jgi:hypothetical protein